MITELFPKADVKISLALPALVFAARVAFAADPLTTAIDTTVAGNRESVQSQQRIDSLADQTRSLLEEYRQATAQAQDLRVYNDQIERLANNQKAEIESLSRQTANLQVTQQKIVPLLLQMLQVLDDFIRLDTPFLQAERKARLAALRALLDRADVTLPEKYRRVMEAYQVEAEYGRTIEAYTDLLLDNGANRTVNFLRIGRVVLLYASLDGAETGYWDRDGRTFRPLPAEYRAAIARGLQIARKEAPPDLIKVPLPAPENAK